MRRTVTIELDTACEDYLLACQKERAFVNHEQLLLQEYGSARSLKVKLHLGVSSFMARIGDDLSDGVTDAIRLLSGRRQELDDQEAICEVLFNTLQAVRRNRQQAAEDTARTFAVLYKQARLELKNRWGKTAARFAVWSDAREDEYAWRGQILVHLLAKVQSGRAEDVHLLRLFFQGNEFRIGILRGFYVRTDGGMKEISPRSNEGRYVVPKDLSFETAFARLVSGQAVVCS